MVEITRYNSSNQITGIFLEGAQEVLGIEKLRTVLEQFPRDDAQPQMEPGPELPVPALGEVGALMQMLEGIYGVQGGRGLALRIGRAAFKYGLKQFGSALGLLTAEYRLLPAPRKIADGLEILASFLAEACSDRITVTDAGSYWRWRAEICPLCDEHQSADPCCHLVVGLLQEFTAWAGGGRFYRVLEVQCRASGSTACEYWVEKRPLD